MLMLMYADQASHFGKNSHASLQILPADLPGSSGRECLSTMLAQVQALNVLQGGWTRALDPGDGGV